MNSVPSRPLIVGIGNAGVSVLDLLAGEEPGMRGLLAVNADTDSLAASLVEDRITVPEGDPRDGFPIVEETFAPYLGNRSVVILCGALGGETGTFFLPALAARSKSGGLATMACIGMPFAFEGSQKRERAESALAKLRGLCDAVMIIDNDRLSGGVPSSAGVGEAFQLADATLLASLRALHGMVFSSGPVRITRGDLKAVLGSSAAATYFGHGKSSGTNRLNEALERALKSRLLTRFSKVRPTDPVLLFLRGPSDLSFAEVQLAVAEVERVAGKECRVKVGVCPDGSPDSPLEVFVIASAGETQPASPPTAQTYGNTVAGTPSRAVSPAVGNAMTNPSPAIAPATRPAKGSKKVAAKQTQAVFNLDGYQRGRFDKSEPTIIEGEDLDVPTFIRKGIKLSSPPTH